MRRPQGADVDRQRASFLRGEWQAQQGQHRPQEQARGEAKTRQEAHSGYLPVNYTTENGADIAQKNGRFQGRPAAPHGEEVSIPER
jgi:hypothetical protein